MKELIFFIALLGVASAAVTPKVICYYSSWAVYRVGDGKFSLDDVDPSLCTHLVYAFIGLGTDGVVQLLDPWNDVGDAWHVGQFQQMLKLKTLNPNIKLQLAIGGFTHGPGPFQQVVRVPAKRAVFVQTAFDLITQYNLDGLDIDWEYSDTVGGTEADKVGLSALLKEMRAKFDEAGLIISIATPANLNLVKNCYQLAEVSKYVDTINIMSYDFHGSWDAVTGHATALHATTGDANLNMEAVLKYYIANGAAPEKIAVGVVVYGRTWQLAVNSNNKVGAPAKGPGPMGTVIPEQGVLSYSEICQNKWPEVFDDDAGVPYTYNAAGTWVSYENEKSVALKIAFAKELGINHVMIWSLETDDKAGACNGKTFPFIRAVNTALGL